MSTYSLNKNSFSAIIGLKNNVTIGRIINENRRPSQKILQMILTNFSNIDANWLLSGSGEMYKKPFDNKAENILLSKMSGTDNVKKMSGKMSSKMSGKMSGNLDSSQLTHEDQESQLIINKQMVQLLIDETKDLSAENAILKKENNDLRAENANLRAENSQLRKESATPNKQSRSA